MPQEGPDRKTKVAGSYAIFQMATAALPQAVFAGILGLINTLRGPPVTTVSV